MPVSVVGRALRRRLLVRFTALVLPLIRRVANTVCWPKALLNPNSLPLIEPSPRTPAWNEVLATLCGLAKVGGENARHAKLQVAKVRRGDTPTHSRNISRLHRPPPASLERPLGHG